MQENTRTDYGLPEQEALLPEEELLPQEEELENDLPEEEDNLSEAPRDEGDAPASKWRFLRKRWYIPAAALLLIVLVIVQLGRGGAGAQASPGYTQHTVGTRDLTLTLSGTGSLSPADSYTVTALVEGEILSAAFEEGDIVEKDQLLYEIDSADAASSIEQAEISLAQSQRNYNQKVESLHDLSLKAPVAGQIVSLAVKPGDEISPSQPVATIRDSATMRLTIPFTGDDALGFHVGQSALVTLDGTFEVLNGTIAEIGGVDERLEGNRLVRQVKIDVPNPGGIAEGLSATATVDGVACSGSGTFAYRAEETVTAGVSGEVSAIHIKEGDTVSRNQLIVTLASTSLQNEIASSADSLRGSQITLENRYAQLEEYSITSPIAGTIIEKFYKQGDTLESGKTLCTIFDLSYLTMTLNIDELDVSKVSVGQPVVVTAEALPERIYQGVVTKVNINGTTSGGVTSYPVTIRIDETEGLLPGMNVQATIVVSQSRGSVAIPVSALQRGNLVLVQGAEAESEMPDSLPEGFAYVSVTTGISDGDYIEITGGLSEGDVIAYIEQSAGSDTSQRQTAFMVGSPMPGGGLGGAQSETRVFYSEGGPPGGVTRAAGGAPGAMGGG